MNRQIFLIAAILLVSNAEILFKNVAFERRCDYDKCWYVSEPYLSPFLSSPNASRDVYLCQNEGWELLVSNAYLTIYVQVSPAPYLIVNYVMVFQGPPSICVVAGLPLFESCSSGTAATTVMLNSNEWTHYHNTQCIIVHVEKMSVNVDPYYNIRVYQSSALIQSSAGLCKRWRCKPVKWWVDTIPAITEICDLYIKAALEKALGTVKQETIDMVRRTCINDIRTTSDPKYAETAIASILMDSVESQLASPNRTEILMRMASLKVVANTDAFRQTERLQYALKDATMNTA